MASQRHVSTAESVFASVQTSSPALAYPSCESVDAHKAWSARVRDRLSDLLHISTVGASEGARKTSRETREGYVLERWELDVDTNTSVPFLLLLPDGARERPVPLVLCAPGTDHGKELLAGEPEVHGTPNNAAVHFPEHNRMAWWYVRQGWAAVCADNPATRERAAPDGPSRPELCVTLLATGRSYLEVSVHSWWHLLEWARSQSWVDRNRIAVSGHSLGTGPLLCLAVLEPGVRALVLNTNLHHIRSRMLATRLRDPMPLWHYVPGMLAEMDRPDLVAAAAPRPVLIAEGATEQARNVVDEAYALFDASDRSKFAYFDEMPRDRELTEVPEDITVEQFKHYSRMHSPRHYFKPDLAIPFLDQAFRSTNGQTSD